MKAYLGVVPAVFVLAALASVGVGVGVPTALAEMQHRNITKFTPNDLPYGVMRAGEAIMGLYRFNKSEWNGELVRVRQMERVELQNKCPDCTQQIQELEQEEVRIMEQERERVRNEIEAERQRSTGPGTGRKANQS